MRSLTCSLFAPQPVQPSLDALGGEIPQLLPCRCQASCGRSINIEQRQTGLPPASHSHSPTPEVAPVTERRRAFQSMNKSADDVFILKRVDVVQSHPLMVNHGTHLDVQERPLPNGKSSMMREEVSLEEKRASDGSSVTAESPVRISIEWASFD